MTTPYRLALIAALARTRLDDGDPPRIGRRAAGQDGTPRPGAAARCAAPRDGTRDRTGLAPGEVPTLALDAASLVVVGALRAWVAPILRPGGDHPAWRDVLGLARLPRSAASAFDRALGLVAAQAVRSIDVRCPSCPAVSPDERLLVAVIAALQADLPCCSHRLLCGWLPVGEAAEAVSELAHLAAALRGAGLVIPRAVLAEGPSEDGQRVLH